MSQLRVGVIGTGKKEKRPDRFGYAMAYRHATAYAALDKVQIVACADIVEENAKAFSETYGCEKYYLDYHEMLAEANLDMVSICTWMHLHEPMVLDALEAGVRAIHCEKPMADTWGGAKRMAAAASDRGVQLTFNHQRRYGAPFVMAKQMLDEGKIGELVRLETEVNNLYDGGTHFIDMMSFFNGESPAKWILGQIDYRQEARVFGSHNENQALSMFEYENGVLGLFLNGAGGVSPVGCTNRLIGTEGRIEVGVSGGLPLRVRPAGSKEWEEPDTNGEGIHGPLFIERAISDVVDCVLGGRKCQLDASNALIATEIIFGTWESSRRRGRVDCPLDIEDNPLAAMVEGGHLQPAPDTGQ